MPAPMYREIARNAGVHIYYEGTDPVYINNRLIGIHMQNDKSHSILLPLETPKTLEELFDGGTIKKENADMHFLMHWERPNFILYFRTQLLINAIVRVPGRSATRFHPVCMNESMKNQK